MPVIQFGRYICSLPNFRPPLPTPTLHRVVLGGWYKGWVGVIIFDFQYKISFMIKYVIRNDDEHCNVESIYYLLYVT